MDPLTLYDPLRLMTLAADENCSEKLKNKLPRLLIFHIHSTLVSNLLW